MNRRRGAFVLAGCVAVAGCGGDTRPKTAVSDVPTRDWRKVARPADRERLRNWRMAWLEALDKVRAGGGAAQIAAQGVLLDPDRALAEAGPPPGPYRCRVLKLAGHSAATALVIDPWFACRVTDAGAVSGFFKTTGSQRMTGTIFRDTDARSVFLGALMLGDETRAMRYGRDAGRDMAGLVERIGPQRWRIVLPYPHFESTLDVVELVPAT